MIESIKDINNALIISNWNYRAYILAGEIYEYFKNFNLAISMFDKAISLFPNNKIDNWEYVYTYIKIGFLRVKNQNLEAAINDFELAYKRDKFYFYKNNEILRKIPQGIKNIIEVNSLIKI
jgi:tetratricopeptide (TPR) repeat protein